VKAQVVLPDFNHLPACPQAGQGQRWISRSGAPGASAAAGVLPEIELLVNRQGLDDLIIV